MEFKQIEEFQRAHRRETGSIVTRTEFVDREAGTFNMDSRTEDRSRIDRTGIAAVNPAKEPLTDQGRKESAW
jgi:hypothetical protein